MLTVDKLNEWGADVKSGLARCMNNEAFYLRMVGMIEADGNYDKLGQALSAGDLQAAFEAAHALKGVLGNLALTPMFDPASSLCEALRGRTGEDYKAMYEELTQARNAFLELGK
jgi:hypothetical protein